MDSLILFNNISHYCIWGIVGQKNEQRTATFLITGSELSRVTYLLRLPPLTEITIGNYTLINGSNCVKHAFYIYFVASSYRDFSFKFFACVLDATSLVSIVLLAVVSEFHQLSF